MEKIKKFINWIAIDGLLHILVCYASILAVTPMAVSLGKGVVAGTIVAMALSLIKEAYDVLVKGSTWQNVWHDLLCDAMGLTCGYLTIFVWWLCSL